MFLNISDVASTFGMLQFGTSTLEFETRISVWVPETSLIYLKQAQKMGHEVNFLSSENGRDKLSQE